MADLTDAEIEAARSKMELLEDHRGAAALK